jgi:hypothetical protein
MCTFGFGMSKPTLSLISGQAAVPPRPNMLLCRFTHFEASLMFDNAAVVGLLFHHE